MIKVEISKLTTKFNIFHKYKNNSGKKPLDKIIVLFYRILNEKETIFN